MFVFSDGACGLTVAGVPELAGLSTYAKRGGRFEPYINTRGSGFGQRPDPNLLTNSQQFEQAAEQAPNVDVLPDGTVEPMRGARIAKTEVASALAVQDVTDGSITGDQPYVLDAAQWDALSLDEKIEAVAAYAADGTCPLSEVERIAEALRDGEFIVIDDSVEATLSGWCAGQSPGGNGSSGATQPPAPSSSNESTSCNDVTITPNSGNFLYDVEAEGIRCESAEELLLAWGRSQYQPRAGPPGYRCDSEQVGAVETRSTCSSDSGDKVISFTAGP